MKFRIEIEFDGWFATEVQAASEKEAREKALAELHEDCGFVTNITQVDVIDESDDEEVCEEEW